MVLALSWRSVAAGDRKPESGIVWGKIIGGVAGFAMGGPFGAVVGAALGHAADSGGLGDIRKGFRLPGMFAPARIAATVGGKQQVFAVCVVVLAAKLAKCD